jgi:hypothetical protein
MRRSMMLIHRCEMGKVEAEAEGKGKERKREREKERENPGCFCVSLFNELISSLLSFFFVFLLLC